MFAPCVWGVTLTRRILFQRSELRFRRTDVEEISLRRLIGIAKFFDVAGDFKNLFTKREYLNISRENEFQENDIEFRGLDIPKIYRKFLGLFKRHEIISAKFASIFSIREMLHVYLRKQGLD